MGTIIALPELWIDGKLVTGVTSFEFEVRRSHEQQWTWRRAVCRACECRRITLICCSCDERVCRSCLHETRPAHNKDAPVCEDCWEEAKSHAEFGPFGPP